MQIGAQVAPGFDDPVQLLTACHDKVRRFAALALRLASHLAERGADQEAAQAAANVLRYFEVAAPLHHADEELDLFVALRALADPQLDAVMAELELEHQSLAALWAQVRPWLAAIVAGQALPPPDALADFARCYPQHAAREEAEVYPAASRLAPAVLQGIGRVMQQRRQG